MTTLLQQANELMAAGNFVQAEALLARACSDEPAPLSPWAGLGMCLLAQRKCGELLQLIELRHARSGDGPQLFSDCLGAALQEWHDLTALEQMIQATPANSVLRIAARYMMAIILAERGDVEACIGEILDLARIIAAIPGELAAMPTFATIAVEARMLESFGAIAEIEATEAPAILGRVTGVSRDASFLTSSPRETKADFIYLSSCDERYLDRFGSTVVRALDEAGIATIYHLHIVDPSPSVDAKLASLQAECSRLQLAYSTEQYGLPASAGYSRASFYACSRLIRLPEIFARYGRDVFMWDMDTEAVRDLPRLLAAMQDADIGYFEMRKTRPSLVCHLAAVYFRKDELTQRFAELNRKYILKKLIEAPYWLLDQTSFFCCTRYLAAQVPSFRIADFSRLAGSFRSHVTTASTAAEKQGLRKVAGL